ncbi:Acyl-coenzyme A:6-aminopenicillanic acid acyl-transferase [Rubripirellula lacrimiformis]|uniref:Acyl-coenzyme A:6-aminopenicillanic acid acyl-transferase n=1 Tax=Rubripirellula lacrimiformis TaxID=1930273 RepID=A0A517N572_9BACT|nr:C45 family autoproteolytic acyltransferase/hydolase [Rubripirellula lacrimiformis]QDT02178.1 Acyl-coenzyme A:6-aminopenicillanic acid acyl-transferase [Rubripirellula lacrimiformis]
MSTPLRCHLLVALCLSVLIPSKPICGAEADLDRLTRQIQPLVACLSGQRDAFAMTAQVDAIIDGSPQRIDARFVRYSDDAFDLDLVHQDYAVKLRRRAEATAMLLPLHNTVFVGRGKTDDLDHLRPKEITARIISPFTSVATYVPILQGGDAGGVSLILTGLTKLRFDPAASCWRLGSDTTIEFSAQGQAIDMRWDDAHVQLAFGDVTGEVEAIGDWPGMQVVELPRDELERQLVRGVRRAGEILAPSSRLTSPPETAKRVDHGELRWIDGQRVVLLGGTPQQIGTAHGELLADEANRCIDSVLYTFGTAQTIRTGRWFRSELADAYARLAPHIPERHRVETRAMAASLGLDPELVEALNVFPELFHCSGFAVFGNATTDGTLYHGRVLDYMTTIGLQDAATTFIVAPQGQHAFANVGYAAFIGSVSGMNAVGISLGEMGGKGEGQWDGVPMATLMRRALEECSTLDQVTTLWTDSPRTCEYFYVFADGKTNQAVGVAATPESIQFVQPGEAHELLGEGIEDAVVLSAGSRLELLRERVSQKYGQINVDVAQWLMSRPVAMQSNLHNVLFVPAEGVFYVANASHDKPAAERPYARMDLNALLKTMPNADQQSAVTPPQLSESELVAGAVFAARDTLDTGHEPSADARACLDGLIWQATDFDVQCQPPHDRCGDWSIRFPSPTLTGDAANDVVNLEWYMARDEAGLPITAPAVVVVHESGSNMTVGRLIASSLRQYGLHAFMIQLPYYGERRVNSDRPAGEQMFSAISQAVTDVRRARDAVAALPLIATDNISVQGTSLGGFVTATAASLDSGFNHVFIMLAGGDLFDVIEKGEKDAARLRESLAERGITGSKLKSLTATVEPTRIAHRLDPATTWIYSAQFDRVVPPASAKILATTAGLDRSHHIEMLANHYSGIIYLPYLLDQMQQQIIPTKAVALTE